MTRPTQIVFATKDTVIAGHGDIIGEKADLALFLGFLQALDARVVAGIAEGRSLEELLVTLDFPEYQNWLRHEDRRVILITEVYEFSTNQPRAGG